MRALVTGGGGFLGGRIVERLRKRGDQVRVLGRRPYPDLVRAGVECIVGDVRDPAAVLAACRGVDAVFHAAAVAGVWGPRRLFFDTNVGGTQNVLDACLRQGVPRLVYTGSPSVVFGGASIEGGDETLPYATRFLAHYPASKAAAEQRVLAANGRPLTSPGGDGRQAGVLYTCAIRPHLIWGPGDPYLVPRVVAAARAGRLRRVGDGLNRVDLTHVEHAAAAHVLAADRLGPDSPVAGQAYFVGDREPVALWPWIDGLLARLGLGPVTRAVPFRTAYRLGAVAEFVCSAVPALGEPRMTRFLATQLAMSHFFRHTRAERDLGYVPWLGMDAALAELATWLAGGGRAAA